MYKIILERLFAWFPLISRDAFQAFCQVSCEDF